MSALVNLQTLLRTLLANTQIGSEKSLFHADIETMDTLTLQLLQPLSKEDSDPPACSCGQAHSSIRNWTV